ncbi:hypothetical protein GGR54DRAFT_602242 [Hypoxylon sp. NC1633]|nr:hypothetical protein GGR54DRAFT_602242 [Hypoxylon sp. NC1633]
MGWFSFLSRKIPSANGPTDDLKAQAYHQTVAANPPIRGTYPVAGNGPSIWDRFQKSHPHMRDAYFNDNDTAAPSPVVPRLLERPSTAPSSQLSERLSQPKSQSGASARRLREPPRKRHGPYRLPPKMSTDGHDDITYNKSIYSAPSPTFAHDRNSSIFSGDSGSTRRFVDLLDAQAFIKPSDFYGRVRAAGTKDFGEDVADRNIVDTMSNNSPVRARDSHANFPPPSIRTDDSEDDLPRSPSKRHSLGFTLRSNRSPLRQVTPSEASREHDDGAVAAKKGLRRRSLHSFVPASSIDRPRSTSIGKMAKDTSPYYFPDFLRERAGAAVQEALQHELFADFSSEPKQAKPSKKTQKAPSYEKSPDSDSVDYLPSHARNNSKQSFSLRVDQNQSTRNPSRLRTMSNISSMTAVKVPSDRDSLHSFQSLPRKDAVTEMSLPSVEESLRTKGDHSLSKNYRGAFAELEDSFYELPPLQSEELFRLKPTRSRLSGGDELHYRTQNQSTISVSGKSTKRWDIETLHERGSSIRRSSLTSETAGSTLSSNPFRPQSGHTTNTSVDLAPRALLPKTVGSGPESFTYEDDRTGQESQAEVDSELLTGSLDISQRKPFIDFVIDEDASSVDSFSPPQRPATEFEKDLLFQGYGCEGSQLPGLFDSPVAKPELNPSQRTRTLAAHESELRVGALGSNFDEVHPSKLASRYSALSLRQSSRPRSSRFRMPAFTHNDSEDDGDSVMEYESEEELNFDIPMRRPRGPRYQSHGSRQRYEAAFRPFSEDDLKLPDIAKLAQLRRDAKAKQRASSMSLRKGKGKGKASDIYVPRFGLDDPSSYADVES